MAEFDRRWSGNTVYGYSVKTNNFPFMLRTALELGFFAEVVSPDEYAFALRCGASAERIIYNGPQKRETVLEACANGSVVNIDNLEELAMVCEKFRDSDFTPSVGLRINYDLESECPGETTCTGIPGRFGISLENGDFERALAMLRDNGIGLAGLHLHQSSKSRSLRIYTSIAETAVRLGQSFGLDSLRYIDIGGGFFGGNFFPGKPTYEEYAETVCSVLRRFYSPERTALVLEPGAAILATSMDYLTDVLNIRDVRGHRIVTVDGSIVHINPFMNPHPTPFTMINPGPETDAEQIIGGSTCMELDRFYPRDIKNLVQHDSRLLFHCCGAYMSTHNSNFINAAPNIYLKRANDFTLLRRKSIDALFCNEPEI